MTGDIELRHLRYFIAVADTLSFTRAAEGLHIAQPALSQQIRQLETRLGTRLFSRVPRVELTRAGEAFLPAARRAVIQVQQAAALATKVGGESAAVVQVGLSSGASLTRFPKLVRRFHAIRPDIEVRMREMHSIDQLEALRRGSLDVAIVREVTTDQSIAMHELLREPLMLILPTRHHLARHSAVRLSRCADEPFVLFPRSIAPTFYDQLMGVCAQAGFSPRVENEARQWQTVAALVASGFGISIAPASVRALHVRGTVTKRLLPDIRLSGLFLCTSTGVGSEPVAAFCEHVLAGMNVDKPRELAGRSSA